MIRPAAIGISLSMIAIGFIGVACSSEGEQKKTDNPVQVVTPSGAVAICNDGKTETTWEKAVACGDTIYRAPGTGSDIWIDPEFRCEYFLSKYSDGSTVRIGPGAPRMAIINGNYVHVCRQ